jgi:hypothetical protein
MVAKEGTPGPVLQDVYSSEDDDQTRVTVGAPEAFDAAEDRTLCAFDPDNLPTLFRAAPQPAPRIELEPSQAERTVMLGPEARLGATAPLGPEPQSKTVLLPMTALIRPCPKAPPPRPKAKGSRRLSIAFVAAGLVGVTVSVVSVAFGRAEAAAASAQLNRSIEGPDVAQVAASEDVAPWILVKPVTATAASEKETPAVAATRRDVPAPLVARMTPRPAPTAPEQIVALKLWKQEAREHAEGPPAPSPTGAIPALTVAQLSAAPPPPKRHEIEDDEAIRLAREQLERSLK